MGLPQQTRRKRCDGSKQGKISRSKGFVQVEGLDFGKTFAPVARLEAIRMLLAFASHHNIKLYQIDVKSAFLNSFINELVYVEQPLGFKDHRYPNRVYRLYKALYGLK